MAGKLRLTEAQQTDVCFLMGLLRAADQFCVDCVKQICERHLSGLVDFDNVEGLLHEAERFQATQLRLHCEWFKRQQEFETDDKLRVANESPLNEAPPQSGDEMETDS